MAKATLELIITDKGGTPSSAPPPSSSAAGGAPAKQGGSGTQGPRQPSHSPPTKPGPSNQQQPNQPPSQNPRSPAPKQAPGLGASVLNFGKSLAKPLSGPASAAAGSATSGLASSASGAVAGIRGIMAGAGAAGAAAGVAAAVVAIPVIAVAAGVAFHKAMKAVFQKDVQTAAGFNGNVALAAAMSDVRMQMAEMRRAQQIGPQLERYEKARGEAEAAVYDIMTEIKGGLLNAALPIYETGVKLLEEIAKALNGGEESKDTITAAFDEAVDALDRPQKPVRRVSQSQRPGVRMAGGFA